MHHKRRIVGLLLFWILFQFLDPLGLETAARGAVGNFISAISAPFHSMAEDPATNEIAVVELTLDGDLWPVPIARHADVLTTILEAKPKAVFVDVRFLARVPGQRLDGFDRVLRSATEQGIPILFARGRPEWAELPEPLTSLGTVNAWDSGPRSYPLLIRSEVKLGEPVGKAHPTAAYDLYRRLCATGTLPGRCAGVPNDAEFTDIMDVRWGSTPSLLQNQISGGCQATASAFDRVGYSMLYGAISLFRVTQNWALQRCRPLLTMNAKDLDRGLAGDETLPVSELLAGRVVFYGVAIEGDNDTTVAPVLGTLPGVQLHAAAFENLLAYGTKYYHEPATVLSISLPRGQLIEISTVEVVLFTLWIVFIIVLTVGRLEEHSIRLLSKLGLRNYLFIKITCCIAGILAFVIRIPYISRLDIIVFFMFYLILIIITITAFSLSVYNDKKKIKNASYVKHLLTIIAFTGWLLVGNEIWWRLPVAECIGLVLFYIAITEAIEGDERSAVRSLTGETQEQRVKPNKGFSE